MKKSEMRRTRRTKAGRERQEAAGVEERRRRVKQQAKTQERYILHETTQRWKRVWNDRCHTQHRQQLSFFGIWYPALSSPILLYSSPSSPIFLYHIVSLSHSVYTSSFLKDFVTSTKNQTAMEKCNSMATNEMICKASDSCAQEGQTAV